MKRVVPYRQNLLKTSDKSLLVANEEEDPRESTTVVLNLTYNVDIESVEYRWSTQDYISVDQIPFVYYQP